MEKGLWLGVANETGGEILIGKNIAEGWLLCMDDPLDKKRYAQIRSIECPSAQALEVQHASMP